jgi:hypothetical protein
MGFSFLFLCLASLASPPRFDIMYPDFGPFMAQSLSNPYFDLLNIAAPVMVLSGSQDVTHRDVKPSGLASTSDPLQGIGDSWVITSKCYSYFISLELQ